MAKQMFLVDTKGTGIGVFRDLITSRSGSVISTGTWVVSGASQVQCTRTGGGELLEHITPQLTGFTLAGNITINIWAYENAATANCGLRARIFRRTSLGVETEIPGSPFDKGVELGIASAVQNWTATPSSGIVFATGDLLVLRLYLVPVGGTMGSTETIAVIYGAGSAGISGDSYITITENPNYTVVFIITPAGGAVFHGSATIKTSNIYTGIGGAVLGGAAVSKPGLKYLPSGKGTFAGTASDKLKAIYSATGGAVLGGAATISNGLLIVGKGGAVLAGAAIIITSTSTVFVGEGSAVFDGAATYQLGQAFFSDGGLDASGAAELNVILGNISGIHAVGGVVASPWTASVAARLF